MEFFLNDPTVVRLPPAETRFRDLHAEPYPDGKRLRVALELTPFQQRPYLELTLTDADGQEIATASIVEPVGWKLEVTLHVRKADATAGSYELSASLSFPELGEMDRRSLAVTIPAAPTDQ